MAKFRTYPSVDSKERLYRPLSRYIRIRFDSTDEPYFIYNYRRIRINSLDHLIYPEMVYDKDGKIIVIGMYETLCNWGVRLFEMHPDGEYIRVWEEVTNA